MESEKSRSAFRQENKIYFASDCHLGIPDYANSLEREKLFVRWLDFVKQDASEIYLLGDIFDFWFEYKTVVPKGYVRLLGKLAELSDAGIIIPYTIYQCYGNTGSQMYCFSKCPARTLRQRC